MLVTRYVIEAAAIDMQSREPRWFELMPAPGTIFEARALLHQLQAKRPTAELRLADKLSA